jgi:hypothetical protein
LVRVRKPQDKDLKAELGAICLLDFSEVVSFENDDLHQLIRSDSLRDSEKYGSK